MKKNIVKTGTAIAAFGALTFGSVAPAQATLFHPAPSHPVTSCSTYDPCKDGGSTGGGHTGGHTGGKDILGGLFRSQDQLRQGRHRLQAGSVPQDLQLQALRFRFTDFLVNVPRTFWCGHVLLRRALLKSPAGT